MVARRKTPGQRGRDAIVKIWSLTNDSDPRGVPAQILGTPVFLSDSATVAVSENNYLGFRIWDAQIGHSRAHSVGEARP